MEYYNNQLCVEVMWLADNGVMDTFRYKYLVKTKQLSVARRACRNTPALVSYDSLPGVYQDKVKDVLGCCPHSAARVSQVESKIKHNEELSSYFREYTFSDGRHLPRETRIEYYNNAIVLQAISEVLIEKEQMRKSRGGRVVHRWDKIREGVRELDRTRWPHNLPDNERRLRDKHKRFVEEGPQSLIHKNFLNKHAASIDSSIKESYLVELMSVANNLDDEQVARFYNAIANKMAWKTITSATVAVWRKKKEITTYAGRRGSSAFSNTKTMQVKRSAPTAPLYFLTLDGWDVELLYQATNKEGVTSYHHRPTVVVVLDACKKYPLGYAVGTHETPELIKEALRSAARHTAELFGKMHSAHQLQSDRYAIKTMTPYYASIAEKVTPARARNAKAKIIEPWFGYLNKKWCQLLPNWSGFGVTSRPDKQPNVESLSKHKASFPTYEGVVKQVEMIISREREGIVEEYLAAWQDLATEQKLPLSTESYLLQFGETTGRTNLLQPSGLHPTLLGQKRTYDSFDVSFRYNAAIKWKVLYDPADLSHVLAVNEDESVRFVLEEKYIQPMALADRKEGDSTQLERVKAYNRELRDRVIEERAQSGTAVREHLHTTGMIENETLSKLLLTDSTGQHKNQKSKARLEVAAAESVAAPKELPKTHYFDKY